MSTVFGIPNVGSTCWLSSLLQLLLSSRHVSLFLSRVNHQDGKRRLTYALQHLPQQTFLVFSLLRQKFADDGQQDSSEGLLFLLDLLHQEHAITWTLDSGLSDMARQVLIYSKQKISPVHHLFQSITRWVDTDKKIRYEPVILSFCEYSKDDNIVSIRDAIRTALTKRRLVVFAPVLLFCVERMETTRLSNLEYELCESFSIYHPSTTLEYECRGVVLHAGAMSHGHYTAVRKDNSSVGQWMICDDHHVRTIDEMPTRIRQVPRLLLFDLKESI